MLYWLLALLIKTKSKIPKTKIVLMVIGLAVILLGTNYSYKYVQSRLFYVRGFQKMQIREDTKALNFYLTSTKLDPSFPQPYIELINTYRKDRHYQKAIEVGKEYLRHSFDFQITRMLGELYFTSGDYRAAIIYFSQALHARESLEVNYKLATAYFMLSKYQKSIQICSHYPSNSRFLYLYAKSLLELGRYNEGLKTILEAIQLNSADPNYWYIKGRLLSSINNNQNALEAFEQAIWLKREFPEAYIEMAQLFIKNNQINSARDCLRKALYYDNTRSDIYVKLQLLKQGTMPMLKAIEKNTHINIYLPSSELLIEKNESVDFTVNLQTLVHFNNIQLACIEPYGWGIHCKLINIEKVKKNQYSAYYKVTGKRDCKVNLGNPWKMNFVAYDEKNGHYNDKILDVCVNDTDEGKILFLITEDFECSEGPHKNDATPNRNDLSVRETEIDLIQKGTKADSIANSYGIKWSHIADLGSSFLRLRWLAKVSQDSGWQKIHHEIRNYYSNSVAVGNDLQLHIHSYNIPGSPNFTQRYDRKSNQLVIGSGKYHLSTPFPDGHFGAWANIYPELGYFDNTMSRITSLFRGLTVYENLLHKNNPNYRILFFRAGEWEFGISEEEMQKSIIALRKNKILAGSNAYKGTFGQKNFTFHRRIGENAYFTSFNNIRKPARSLLDIGILEIVPVTELHHYSHVRPIDDPKSIRTAYDLCFDSTGKIKSGVHLLMEMFHINRVNYGDARWDSLDSNYGDWLRMRRHFENVSRYATRAQFATVSQAIIDYLDYYTPDIVALRVNEQKEDETTYIYDIKMIGSDIQIDPMHPHYVSIKPPSYFVDTINTVVLLHNGKKVKTWDNIMSYEDLEFEAIAKSGYQIKITIF